MYLPQGQKIVLSFEVAPQILPHGFPKVTPQHKKEEEKEKNNQKEKDKKKMQEQNFV